MNTNGTLIINLILSQMNPFNPLKIFLSHPFKYYSQVYALVFSLSVLNKILCTFSVYPMRTKYHTAK
jgi:hypothetical protein